MALVPSPPDSRGGAEDVLFGISPPGYWRSAFPLIQCIWFALRGGSWVLNASRSGAGVSNALPYYLLLIGSAFVGLLRCAVRFLVCTIDYYHYSGSCFVNRRIGQIKRRMCCLYCADCTTFIASVKYNRRENRAQALLMHPLLHCSHLISRRALLNYAISRY